MAEITRTVEMPKELLTKVIFSIYQLCEWGVSVDGAVEIARVIIENYWRDKNADKSGH